MAFLRGVTVSPEEGLVYNYWITVFYLLDIGFSYDHILELSESDVSLVLGAKAALDQREKDERERQERAAELQSRYK